MVISMFFGIYLIYKYKLPQYLKIITIYTTIAGIGAIIALLIHFKFSYVWHVVINIFDATTVLLLSLLTYFFCSLLPNKYIRYIAVIFIFSLILTVIILIKDWNSSLLSRSFIVSNFALILMAITYYWDLLNSEPRIDILRDPAFWVVTGIFIGMAANVVLLTLSHLLFVKYDYLRYALTSIFASFFYAFMHLFFVKAFICYRNSRQS